MSSIPENKIDLKVIKALSKEKRQELASEIRKDNELWNAVNGMGGLSENSEKSKLQGTITNNNEIIGGAKIAISIKGKGITETTSNQLGYFSVELKADDYTAVISKGNDVSEEISVKTKSGVTSTLDYDFKSDGGGKILD